MQPTLTPEIGGRAARLLRYEADIAFRRRVRSVLEFIDPRPGERVLDAGCGLGFYLHLLERLSQAEVWGVELDGKRLAAARADNYARRARLLLGDVTRLPLADAGFDRLIISEVLEHVEDDRGALAEVVRVLRPGGVCAVTVPNAAYPFLWDPINYLRERLGLGHFESEPWSGIWTDHRRLYTKAQIVALAEDAGLAVTDVALATRFALPFSHQLIYGLGKYLIERNLAGGTNGARASRFSFWTEDEQLTPARLLAAAFTAIDRFNAPSYDEGPSVNICLRAVKPA